MSAGDSGHRTFIRRSRNRDSNYINPWDRRHRLGPDLEGCLILFLKSSAEAAFWLSPAAARND